VTTCAGIFPIFFAEARFQVGDDDYFLYARFGAYLARAIELKRTPRARSTAVSPS